MNKIKKFYSDNIIIMAMFIIATICVISYIITLDMPEWIPRIEKWYNLLFQLSVGYIINFSFYVTQVYIPEQKRKQNINKCIRKKVNTILIYMKEPFDYMADLYSEHKKKDDYLDNEIFNITTNLNLDDIINKVNVRNNENFTMKLLISDDMIKLNNEKDKLFLYYSAYISEELMTALENITSSIYYTMMSISCSACAPSKFNGIGQENNCFIEYYNLYKKLKKVSKSYAD